MQRAAPEKKEILCNPLVIFLDNLTCAIIQSIISVNIVILFDLVNGKYDSCRFSTKNLQTGICNLYVIITSRNKNILAVHKIRMKHGTFIKRKTNTAMKAGVIKGISRDTLTNSETLSFMIV